jgi:glutamate carboxypeptidase
MLHAGTTINTVPDLAVLEIDARSFSQDDLQRVDTAIKNLQPNLSGARIEVAGGLHRPPLQPSATAELYAIAEKVAAEIGISPLGFAEVGGASDGNFAAAAGARVLDGLGAVGGGAHAANEWVSLSSIEPRSAFLHAFIKELLA